MKFNGNSIHSQKEINAPTIVAAVPNDKEEKNSTSQELLDEVLRKLDLLDADKRSRILEILKRQHAPANQTGSKGAGIEDMKPDQGVDDEVEILDMDEPKLGKYKRKRSRWLTRGLAE